MNRETQAIIDGLEANGLFDNGSPSVPFMVRFPDGYRAGYASSEQVKIGNEIHRRLCRKLDIGTIPGLPDDRQVQP